MSREINEILGGSNVVKRVTEYDPYKNQQSKVNTDGDRTKTIVMNTTRKLVKDDHYEVESLHFNIHL